MRGAAEFAAVVVRRGRRGVVQEAEGGDGVGVHVREVVLGFTQGDGEEGK